MTLDLVRRLAHAVLNRVPATFQKPIGRDAAIISPVLPTPAPPKSPLLPSRSRGANTSLALIPVTNTSQLYVNIDGIWEGTHSLGSESAAIRLPPGATPS